MTTRSTPTLGRPPGSPDGTLDVTIVYLEMWSRPERAPVAPRADAAVVRAHSPTVSYYRFLYDHVGGPWLWYERRQMNDRRLARIVQDPAVEVDVLQVGGVPAGYVELDGRVAGEIELAYFGLMPEFIGHGLGAFFLAWAVQRAWELGPRRVWVHTCSLDHPRALATYLRAGFGEYAREKIEIADPRVSG